MIPAILNEALKARRRSAQLTEVLARGSDDRAVETLYGEATVGSSATSSALVTLTEGLGYDVVVGGGAFVVLGDGNSSKRWAVNVHRGAGDEIFLQVLNAAGSTALQYARSIALPEGVLIPANTRLRIQAFRSASVSTAVTARFVLLLVRKT